jgi:hypothetical protein
MLSFLKVGQGEEKMRKVGPEAGEALPYEEGADIWWDVCWEWRRINGLKNNHSYLPFGGNYFGPALGQELYSSHLI